jgi:hypothetical protein
MRTRDDSNSASAGRFGASEDDTNWLFYDFGHLAEWRA